MSLIDATGMTIRHGKSAVLRNVNFKISKGEIVTIVGPNGSGKSTLLRALIGAIDIHKGTISRKDLSLIHI